MKVKAPPVSCRVERPANDKFDQDTLKTIRKRDRYILDKLLRIDKSNEP